MGEEGGEKVVEEVGVELEQCEPEGVAFTGGSDLLRSAEGIELGFIGTGADSGEDVSGGGGGSNGAIQPGGEAGGVGGVEHGGGEIERAIPEPAGPVLAVFGRGFGGGIDGRGEANTGVDGANDLGGIGDKGGKIIASELVELGFQGAAGEDIGRPVLDGMAMESFEGGSGSRAETGGSGGIADVIEVNAIDIAAGEVDEIGQEQGAVGGMGGAEPVERVAVGILHEAALSAESGNELGG